MLRVRDAWANVEVDHLDATEKKEAMEIKERTIDIQEQRDFVDLSRWDSETSWAVKRSMAELDAYLDTVLYNLEKDREIIIFETWGNANRWEEGRKKIDGEGFYQNEESAGVTAILIQLLKGDGKDVSAFICIAEILEKEARNRPILPERLKAVIAHPNSIFIGENIAQHFMRLENSFYDCLNRPLYIGLTDLVDRWKRWKIDIFDVRIDPFFSRGILGNFQFCFPRQTFFKNAFECCANWNVTVFRKQQHAYALENLEAMACIIRATLAFYREHNFQLSVMTTIYPRRVESSRVDNLFKKRGQGVTVPKLDEERRWPRASSDRSPSCPFGLGDPERIRELQRDQWDEKCRRY